MSGISERLEKQAELLFENVRGWENNALRRIGLRIKNIKSLSYADLQGLNNATIAKQDIDAVLRELAKLTKQSAKDVKKVYSEMLREQHLENEPLYDYRNKEFVPFDENKQLQAIVKAYARTTAETMINLSMTKARKLGTVDKNGKFIPLEKNFKEILDKAVMSISTGTGDFNSEMRDVLKQLGGSGLRVDYGGGVTRRLDSMVRQNLLWGAKQASVEYNEMIGEELDCDGIEIDWHSNPRPSHEFMQGKQYSLYGEKTIKGVTYESADKALEALNDYGCLHFKTPIILGVSKPRYSPEELARLNRENKKLIEIDGACKTGWEWKQTMRALERGAREAKGQIEVLKAAGDTEGVRKLKIKLSAIKDRYNRIAESTGIKAQYERMSIVKGNPPKTVDKSVESGISNKYRFRTEENKVDVGYISSNAYKSKFAKLPYDEKICDNVYKQSKAMLEHRNGTYYEDICLINRKTGDIMVKSYNNRSENEVLYSEKAEKIVSQNPHNLIAIHNHGTNNPPTGSDFVSAGYRKYSLGVVVCHNGTVYTYRVGTKPFTKNYFDLCRFVNDVLQNF